MEDINARLIKTEFSGTYHIIHVVLKNMKIIENMMIAIKRVLSTYFHIREFLISHIVEREEITDFEKFERVRENRLMEYLNNEEINKFILQFRKLRQIQMKNDFTCENLYRKHFTVIFKDENGQLHNYTQKNMEFVYQDLEDFYKLVKEILLEKYNLDYNEDKKKLGIY